MISVVVPTYNEKDNIESLVAELLLVDGEIEIVIVDDDSPDGTGRVADGLAKKNKNIRVLHRKGRRGLGSAIVEGLEAANGDIIGVMDADFSHPPHLIRGMKKAFDEGADIVLGSRYVKGGRIENWPMKRKIVSKAAVYMARLLINVKDPVTGFFFLRRKIFRDINIKSGETKSWKVSLEVLVRGRYKKVVELPYVFTNRRAGKSKISAGEYKTYLGQLVNLLAFKMKTRKR